jgi:hypothetical protein
VEIEAKGLRVNLANAVWQKTSRSGPYSDNCVEIAFVDGAIAMRDSKHPDGPVLPFTPSFAPSWKARRTASSI